MFFFVEACETTLKRKLAAPQSDARRALGVSYSLTLFQICYCPTKQCLRRRDHFPYSLRAKLSIGQRVKSLLCATIC